MSTYELLSVESEQSDIAVDRNILQVSIGMPVHNGAHSIREALDSLLAQTFTDFELIISDNASTDGTDTVCREYAKRDSRIKYIRQFENIGALANFHFVLDKAVGNYFMWAAADDVRSDSFLELNYNFLKNNKDYVASTSPVRFQNYDFNSVKMGDFALDQDDSNIRIYHFFTKWHANGRFYSLIKRCLLQKFPHKEMDILGADWLLVIYLASKGKLANIKKGYVILGNSGMSNSINIFKKYNNNIFLFFVPFYYLAKLTFPNLNNAPIILIAKITAKLVLINFQALKLNIKWAVLGRKA